MFDKAKDIVIISMVKKYKASLDIEGKKKEWIELIEENPNIPRRELKRIGKGVQTYVYKYARQWYEEVTPKYKRKNNKKDIIDWKERDRVLLDKVKEVVNVIANKEGKPIRVCENSIIRELGITSISNKIKLKKTKKFIEKSNEDINSYRRRKIKWAIKELMNEGSKVTRNKIEIRSGLGNGCSEEVKKMIEDELIVY